MGRIRWRGWAVALTTAMVGLVCLSCSSVSGLLANAAVPQNPSACESLPRVTPLRPSSRLVATRKPQWIIQNQGLTQLRKIPSARRALDNARVFNIRGAARPYQAANTMVVEKFPSFAALQTALKVGHLQSGTRAVLYDPEAWTMTPLTEQRQWGAYAKKFVVLAHSKGLVALVAPALDLVSVVNPTARGSFSDRYLGCSIPAIAAASGADGIVVQSQSLENRPQALAAFVKAAAGQIKRVNSKASVFGGLSTGPTGIRVTSPMLTAAARAVGTGVQGYWLNTPGGSSTLCPGCTGGAVTLAVAVLTYVTSMSR